MNRNAQLDQFYTSSNGDIAGSKSVPAKNPAIFVMKAENASANVIWDTDYHIWIQSSD
ncbi:hypothetical protein [Marivirga arenosa]|uniref:Uncharacterized protein n=1 Tax=Marivirga arenosa TaxID=3059076 RepID=A0AA49JCT2_9BACT|nr:hypothetical protein [Marivirga sp. BKB1-2]WKK80482.1 hypothetical protein QYS47_25610 [Marivirga sp. BKB1-2]